MLPIPPEVLALLRPLVTSSEGCSLQVYLDPVGILTVGWGHKVRSTDCLELGDMIDKQRSDSLLDSDLSEHYSQLAAALPDLHTLATGQQAALTDFVYNLGIGTFLHTSLPALVANRDWPGVKKNLAEWVHASGKVLPGLVTRRQKEIELIGE